MTQRQATTVLIGIFISSVFLWVAGRNTNLADIVSSFRRVQIREILLLVIGMVVFYWIRTYRWKVLLAPIANVTTARLFGPVMIGYGANFLFPLQLGEVARSLAAREKTQLPFMPIAFSIILERIFDFLVILAALALSLALQTELPRFVTIAGIAVGFAVFLLIVLTVFYTLKTESVLKIVKRVMFFLPVRGQEVVLQQLRSGADGLQSLRHHRALTLAAGASVVQWLIIVICIDISLRAVELHMPIATLLLILAFMVLGGLVPNAPGYIGSIQAAFVVALEVTGADPAKGMAASIVYHSVYALTAVMLGLVSMRGAKLDWRSVTTRERI